MQAEAAWASLPTWGTRQTLAHQEPETPAWGAPFWRATRELQRAHEAARMSRAKEVISGYSGQLWMPAIHLQ